MQPIACVRLIHFTECWNRIVSLIDFKFSDLRWKTTKPVMGSASPVFIR